MMADDDQIDAEASRERAGNRARFPHEVLVSFGVFPVAFVILLFHGIGYPAALSLALYPLLGAAFLRWAAKLLFDKARARLVYDYSVLASFLTIVLAVESSMTLSMVSRTLSFNHGVFLAALVALAHHAQSARAELEDDDRSTLKLVLVCMGSLITGLALGLIELLTLEPAREAFKQLSSIPRASAHEQEIRTIFSALFFHGLLFGAACVVLVTFMAGRTLRLFPTAVVFVLVSGFTALLETHFALPWFSLNRATLLGLAISLALSHRFEAGDQELRAGLLFVGIGILLAKGIDWAYDHNSFDYYWLPGAIALFSVSMVSRLGIPSWLLRLLALYNEKKSALADRLEAEPASRPGKAREAAPEAPPNASPHTTRRPGEDLPTVKTPVGRG